MPGKYTYGEKIEALAAVTQTVDLSKSARVFTCTPTGACIVTLSNPPQGFTELHFLVTDPTTNFDILGCLWTAGTKTFTTSGLDYLRIGITRSGSTIVIHEISREMALAAD